MRRPVRLLVAGALVASGSAGALAGGAGAAGAGAAVRASSAAVVVTGAPGALATVEQAVTSLGGRIRRELPIVQGVAAVVPEGMLTRLRAADGVRSVTPDASGRLLGVDPALGYDVTGDEGSLFFAAQVVHAQPAWAKNVTGQGVDVALIDSGVVPVRGLTSGNVITGPDLSIESQNPYAGGRDTYGHGTHMASIIAGRDAAGPGAGYADAGRQFTGIAPDARIVSLKVATSDGAADVSQVIAAIDWVAQHAHSDGLNIRVLNLSYGTDSVQDYRRDPLDYAVENAWRAGITVVVSAGNDGTTRAELADPANDPLVVAVGAEDPNNTTGVQDDVIPAFSQRGTDARAVDVIAPGVHLLGLRDPGSFIDQHNPAARAGTRFFRGSGTSQAAAVVSGLAALYLSRFPVATPDQVKDALQHSARIPKLTRKVWTGLGVPDASKLIGYSPVARGIARPGRAAGTGTLDGARGTSRVTDGLSVLTGEQDLFGQPWTATAWAAASGAGTSWTGGSWNGSVWTGSAMAGPVTWGSATWTGSDWNSRTWLDAGWDSRTWLATGWDSRTWLDAGWASTGLQAAAWSAAAWN